MNRWVAFGLLFAALWTTNVGLSSVACAQEAAPAAAEAAPAAAEAPAAAAPETAAAAVEYDVPDDATIAYSVDNLLLFISAVLVIFMQAGFAFVEIGLNSAKNAVNILFKNTIDFCIGVLLYYFIGYALMYPGADFAGKYFGYAQPDFQAAVSAEDIRGGFSTAPGTLRKLNPQIDFLFQAAFCATTATIVSGAVAGRMKFTAYLVYTCVITGLVYPMTAMWKWGGGWLNAMGMVDFAGSIVVHACGGWAALAGAMFLGPRIGRFSKDGRAIPWPGHNLAFACLGVFVLLIGWYGFNPGSNLAFVGAANLNTVGTVATNTTLAACAGGLVGMFFSWILFKKPDFTMALNGILAGLVGITANCHCVTNINSIYIGSIAGVIVVLGIMLLDKLKIDDPVGAFPVHGLCGMWGGIATGIFGVADGLTLKAQVIGSLAIPLTSFVAMSVVFCLLKATGQLRVTPEEEIAGLDMHEHGMICYGSDPSLVV
jgi:Amt family ammonium transporter